MLKKVKLNLFSTAEEKYLLISTMFIMLMIISNLLATKLIQVGPLTLTPAVLVYPFSFMFGDIMTEVYGYEKAKRIIVLGFISSFLLVLLTTIAIYLPYPPFFDGQEAFARIFSATPRIILASFIAYLAGNLTNSKAMVKIKEKTGEKKLWVRTIGSTIVGEFVDTGIFITLAFIGTMPIADFLWMLLAQYIIKVLCEALGGTPLAYAFIKWARK